MSPTQTQRAIAHPARVELWIEHPDGSGRTLADADHRLPTYGTDELRVDVIEHVDAWTRASLGRQGVVLGCLAASDIGSEGEPAERVYRVALKGSSEIAPWQWILPTEISPSRLSSEALDPPQAAEQSASTWRDWSRAAWYDEARSWMMERLTEAGERPAVQHPTEPIPFRVGSGSCLLRIRASGVGYFFKAIPEDSKREVPLTLRLAERFPERLPEVVASDTERGWLLMREIEGRPLYTVSDLVLWQQALSSYAALQEDQARDPQALLAVGCTDHRPERLNEALESFVEEAASWLADSAYALNEREVSGLRASLPGLRRQLGELAAFAVPNALEHGDFHPNNIHVGRAGAIFIDWSDGGLSHPFFSLAAFLTYVEHLSPALFARRESLRDAYLEPWSLYEPRPRLDKLFALAQQLSGLRYGLLLCRALDHRRGAGWWETRELKKALARCVRAYTRPVRWGR